jgi:NTP pyrophosphatase (non-canonical NTP hydrolase)
MSVDQPASGGLDELRRELDAFVRERNWGQFHSAKNLVMALSAEVGELTEHFMWLTPAQSDALPPETAQAVADEIGDVFIYLLHLAERLGIDPVVAALRKLDGARAKYPVDGFRMPDGGPR